MHSSTAIAHHMPVSPKRGTRTSALPTRTSQMLPRFRRLGTSVSPAPRSARRHNRSPEQRLCQKFDAKHARGKLLHIGNRREHAEDQRTKKHHHSARAGHEKRAEGNTDIAVSFCAFHIARADRPPDQRRSGVCDAVARHVADALCRDGKGVCRNRQRAEGVQ